MAGRPSHLSKSTKRQPSHLSLSSRGTSRWSALPDFSFSSFFLPAVFCLCSVMPAPSAFAQTTTGSVVGSVTDPTGAVVQGAQVIATNVETGVETSTITGKDGAYSIRFLPIGHYKVSVLATGFESAQFVDFALEIDQTAKVDAKLKIGASTTAEVFAEGDSNILNTADSSLGVVMTNEQIQSIPLDGRNFATITLFEPGALATSPQGLTGNNAIERNNYGSDQPSVNGNRAQANNYLLDGISINQIDYNLVGYNPAPEALGQIKVITSNASAEYGNVNGGDVLAELKSGTSHFHGAAYAYIEDGKLNANTWGNKDQVPVIPRGPYTQSIFGGTLGGPIGKKLFFFVDYEGVRQHTGGVQTASILTQQMLNGDFSGLLTNPYNVAGFTPTQLYDPQNGFTPFANNQLPASMQTNSVAQYLLAHPEIYPVVCSPLTANSPALPASCAHQTAGATAASDGVINNNFQGSSRTYVANDQADIKLDWTPRDKDRLSTFYVDSQPHDATAKFEVNPVNFQTQNSYPTHVFGLAWTHTFSPALINAAHVGFTRVNFLQGFTEDLTGEFGLSGDSKVGVGLPYTQTSAGFTAQNTSASVIGNSANPAVIAENQYTYSDDLILQSGRHVISVGVQAVRYQSNGLNGGNAGFLGSFTYTGNFTASSTDAGGYSAADFILNRIDTGAVAQNGGSEGDRQWRSAEYVQDNWRVNDTLTLNLGLRYQFDQPWYEVQDRVANVILSGPNKGLAEYASRVPAGAPAGSILCSNRACYNPNYDQIMPRLGFAWQVSPKAVVRGGYGASSHSEGNYALGFQAPFQKSIVLSDRSPTFASPGVTAAPGTPYNVQTAFTVNTAFNPNGGSVTGGTTPNFHPSYAQAYNLTVEYALDKVTSLSVGYVGQKGDHLPDYYNANQLPYVGAPSPFGITQATPSPTSTVFVNDTQGAFNYNGLQATLRGRQSHGLTYTVNYTYAKALTNSSGEYNTPEINGQNGAFQNYYNPGADWGPSGQDVRHNISQVGEYRLPVGQGGRFLPNANKFVDAVIGGWRVSESFLGYSGFPVTINGPQASAFHSYGQTRANHYRPLIVRNRSKNNWFGTDASATPCTTPGVDNGVCAYGQAAPNTFGTAAVNTERAPGYKDFDLSTFKDFHLYEENTISFRADFFNVLNMASLDNPGNSIASSNLSTFGLITGARSNPRKIQFSLKYQF